MTAQCLWPRTLIATAAVQHVVGGDEGMRASRRPEVMADAAMILLSASPASTTGGCYLDADVLAVALDPGLVPSERVDASGRYGQPPTRLAGLGAASFSD